MLNSQSTSSIWFQFTPAKEAGGTPVCQPQRGVCCFNSLPPKGGRRIGHQYSHLRRCFNSLPPFRREIVTGAPVRPVRFQFTPACEAGAPCLLCDPLSAKSFNSLPRVRRESEVRGRDRSLKFQFTPACEAGDKICRSRKSKRGFNSLPRVRRERCGHRPHCRHPGFNSLPRVRRELDRQLSVQEDIRFQFTPACEAGEPVRRAS